MPAVFIVGVAGLAGLALGAAGCARDHRACLPDRIEGDRWRAVPVNVVDLVVVVDNSSGMLGAQARLRASIPAFIDQLADPPLNPATGTHAPVQFLHVGVLTTDLGSGDANLASCRFSDQGLFVREYRIADRTHPLFDATCVKPYPTYLAWAAEGPGAYAPAELAHDLGCLVSLGDAGCPFPQPLESVYQALTVHLSDDGLNGGLNDDPISGPFLRGAALLAILVLSDKDDCSIADYALLDPANTGLGPMSLRCFNGPGHLYWIDRYRNGIPRDLTPPHPLSWTLWGDIGGLPLDLSGQPPSTILGDPRMAPALDPADPNRLLPSCTGSGIAGYPPRRRVEVLDPYESLGQALAYSICEDDLGPALQAFAQKIQDARWPRCLQRPLGTNAGCGVDCRIIETLRSSSCAVGERCARDCLPIVCAAGDGSCGRVVLDPYLGARTECVLPRLDLDPATPEPDGLCRCLDRAPAGGASACAAEGHSGWWYDARYSESCPRAGGPYYGTIVYWGNAVPRDDAELRFDCTPPRCPGG